jgi:hypothetical protein
MTAPIIWTLVLFSCPAVLLSTYLHFGVPFYWVLIANAATYALIGLLVEGLRVQWRLAE